MSKKLFIIAVLIVFNGGFIVGAVTILLLRSEAPEKAYERGLIQGYLTGTYQVTEIVDESFSSNITEVWEYSVRECLGDTIVDEFLAGMVDSTDTMSVVDRDTITSKEGQYLLNTE